MRIFALLLVFSLAFTSSVVAATTATKSVASTKNPLDFPSTDSIFGSMVAGDGKDVSLADSLDKMMQSMSEAQAPIENTEQTVHSAIEGKLVVEEKVPELNKEVVEAVDKKTQRYSPRLELNFQNFPLARTEVSRADAGTARIAKHLQERLKLSNQVQLTFQGRTAYLRGTVPTERQKELAEMMLRLEPGIDVVKNELAVLSLE